ncbi:MAG TPA: hypothetical protein PKZ36_00255 [Candidatus Paceibacterota bacterium]|nr:hypothetical protein [Candidatus Paceibacterota bacterium]HPT17836.1 hypothetical protein [Candidatus Paceibacterota bacterium]
MEQLKINFESAGERMSPKEERKAIIEKFGVGPGVQDTLFKKNGQWFVEGENVEVWKRKQDKLYDPRTDTTANGSNRSN